MERASRFALFVCALVFIPKVVHAGGFELTPAGARENGRAGAEFAGGDSAMSLFYNPAGLTRLRDSVSLTGSVHLHLAERCYDGVEVNEAGGTPTAGAALPSICGHAGATIIPELAGSIRLGDRAALGFGLYVPTAGARHIRFGSVETGTFDPDGSGPMEEVPSPSRYQLMEQDLLQLFLTVGAAVDVHPRVHVGAAFGWGITKVSFSNAAYSRVDVIGSAVTATADARSDLSGLDAFVPRLSLGISAEPIASVPLTIGAAFDFTGHVRTDSAKLGVTSLSTHIEPAFIGDLVGDLPAEGQFTGIGLDVPQNARLAFGLRYASRLDSPADGIGDRLSTERFDVELDVVVTLNKGVDQFEIDLPDDAMLVVESPVPLLLADIEVQLPDAINLAHRWRTQVAISIGSDVSVIPGVLALRGGLRYETSGVTHGYEQLDFTPFRNVSAHLGATVRIAKRVDVSLALGHMFVPDVNVAPDEARIRRIVGGDADPNSPADASFANAGRYRTSATMLVLGAGVHLGAPPVAR